MVKQLMVKVFVVSLGCSKNHCDLENMMAILLENGYEITMVDTEADVAIVNTCGFIQSAKEEAIDNILTCAQLKTTGRLKALIVTGCLAQRYREELLEQFPEMKGLQPTAYLPLGYPAETAHPSRLHADRKPLEELAVFL